MDIASSIATSRLVAQRHAIDVIANNIANADTPGYQAERMQFADWLSTQTGAATPPGGRVLAYTQDRATWRETEHGPLRHTAPTRSTSPSPATGISRCRRKRGRA